MELVLTFQVFRVLGRSTVLTDFLSTKIYNVSIVGESLSVTVQYMVNFRKNAHQLYLLIN